MKSEKIYSGFEKNTRRRRLPHGAYLPGRGQGLPVLARRGAERPGRRRQPACVPTSSQIRSIVVDRNCKAAEPPSAPAPCRSGVRGRSAIYASHFRDAIYLNQAEAETLFRVCSANFNLTLFQFFSTNLRENSAGSSALINRK